MDLFLYDNGLRHERINLFIFLYNVKQNKKQL